jgi:hypothetical protein
MTPEEQLEADGWQLLAGPFNAKEEGMMKGFITDAHNAGRQTLIRELGYRIGTHREDSKMIWQRGKSRFPSPAQEAYAA